MTHKVAIYCRLSEEDKNKSDPNADSNSIQNQKTMLIEYAIEQGWNIYQIYSDDDYTGADRHRPQFKRLLADARERRFDIILCKTQSRFTRELEMVEKYIHGLFPLWGVRFVSIVDHADTCNPGNKKSRQINGLVNEWYIEDMSQNIKSVLDNKRRCGLHIGSFALYGYRKDPQQKGHLIIDPEAAAVVKTVFRLFLQGYGKTAIARFLNDHGIPNPTEYKRSKGLRYQQPMDKNATLWRYSAISHMLSNEMYIGNMVQGKYGSVSYKSKYNAPRPKENWLVVENTHEAIIDREQWERVQILLQNRSKPCCHGQIGLFARKVRCATCGYTLRSSKNRGRYYLRCHNRCVSPHACVGAFIPVAALEKIVLTELERLSSRYLDKGQLEKEIMIHDDAQRQSVMIKQNISNLENRIRRAGKAIKEAYLDKTKGILSEADYFDLAKAFSNERERCDAALLKLRVQLDEAKRRSAARGDRKMILEEYVKTEHLNRTMVDTLVDYIEVGRRDPGHGAYPVVIHWNF